MLFLSANVVSQSNIDLEKKVNNYIEAKSPESQYDALADLMEFNATVSLEEAEYYIAKYATDSKSKDDPRYILLSHFIAADVLYYNENVDSSLFHYLSLASSGKFENENMLAASGLGNAAYVLSDLGDKLGAINLLKQNVTISQNTGDIRDYADHTFNIAKFYDDLGIRDSAIHYFEKTVEIDRVRNNANGMLYNMHSLLEQYIDGEKYEEALGLCSECLLVSKRIGDLRAEAQCRSSQAVTFLKKGMLSDAEKSINNAILIDERRKDETRMSSHYRIKANILSAEKKFKSSNDNFEKAIKLAQQYKSKEDLILTHLAYSQALLGQQQYDLALSFAENASENINDDQFKQYELKSLQLLSDINLQKGDIEEALRFEQMETKLLSSMLSNDNMMVADQSKNAFDLFKLENINRTLTTEKELAEAKIRRRNMIILASALIIFLLIILAYFAYQNQRQKSRLKEQNLEIQVVEKELLALRSQMNPHFLFNSLNSINDYIMHEEPRIASKYLTKFSHLMRTILNNSKQKLIPLSKELEALSLYVEMENLRFSKQFDYQVSIDPKISLSELMIPSMILQPYIENAIKHGLRNNSKNGILKLSITQSGARTYFEIYDNGIGREEAMQLKSQKDEGRKSHGMAITSDRIKALNKIYNMNASMRIEDHVDPTGTSVYIELEPQ